MRYEPSGPVGHRPKPRNPVLIAPRGSSGWANRPSGSACQVSTSASVTGSPAPSNTLPVRVIAPAVPSGTTNGPSGQGSPIARNGPTVWDGVSFAVSISWPPSRAVGPGGPPWLRETCPRRRDTATAPGAPYAAFGPAAA